MLDAEAIKAKLPDVPGIETLAITIVGDRAVAAFDGRTTSVAHNASEAQMILAIRNASSLRAAQLRAVSAEPEQLSPQPLPVKGPIMTKPAPGGFAAQIKAMLSGARADLENAKADGLKQVGAAVTEMRDAQAQVQVVAATMVKVIKDETADVLAELGQISNMPPE